MLYDTASNTIYSIFEGNLYAEINFIFNQIKLLSIMVSLCGLLFIGNLRQNIIARIERGKKAYGALAHVYTHIRIYVDSDPLIDGIFFRIELREWGHGGE